MSKSQNSSKNQSKGLEVTVFKLNRIYTFEAFVKANYDVDAWLATKPAFEFRKMCLRDDGYVVDIIGWRTARDGKAIGGSIVAELPDSLVHEMIDQKTVFWNVMNISHSIN